MSDDPRNPQAFPQNRWKRIGEIEEGKSVPGMTLLDYFAAAVMPAIIQESCAKAGAKWEDCMEAASTLAFLIADAMLKAREP